MDGLLELIFEGVSAYNVDHFMMELINDEDNVAEIIQDGNGPLLFKPVFDGDMWNLVASSDDDTIVCLNLKQLSVGLKSIKRATLQLVHYDHVNDIVVLFSTTDCKYGGVIYSEEIYRWAEGLAKSFNIGGFLGGLEPAADEEAQIFSVRGVGPIAKL
ncbi:hypothetical protein WKI45_16255 [Delftia tsuruhatensis]